MAMKSEIDIAACIRHDLFAAIKYENPQGRKGGVIGMQLGPHFVFRWIFLEAWKHISAGVLTVNKGDFHSSEALFNDAEAWAGHDIGTRIAIGRCLVYFVTHKMLPLQCVKPGGSNKLYGVIYQ